MQFPPGVAVPMAAQPLPFRLLGAGLDVAPLLEELDAHPDLWNAFSTRKTVAGSPHTGTSDIWLRYNDLAPFEARGDFKGFNDPHIPVNYPAWRRLPLLRAMVFGIATTFQAEMIGGVLVSKIPAGGGVRRHADAGWHVEYLDKVYLQLLSAPGQVFHTDVQAFEAQPGEVYLFDNRVEHWVVNDSPIDRITLIVCLRTGVFGKVDDDVPSIAAVKAAKARLRSLP